MVVKEREILGKAKSCFVPTRMFRRSVEVEVKVFPMLPIYSGLRKKNVYFAPHDGLYEVHEMKGNRFRLGCGDSHNSAITAFEGRQTA